MLGIAWRKIQINHDFARLQENDIVSRLQENDIVSHGARFKSITISHDYRGVKEVNPNVTQKNKK